jgi:hypothetical protein
MSQPTEPTRTPANPGKLNDPLFLFMLAAVLLALGSSFMLRAAVNGFSPPAAHAASNHPPQAAAPADDGQ